MRKSFSAIIFAVFLLLPDLAYAGLATGCSNDFGDLLRCKMWNVFYGVRDIIFVMGGFGLVGMAVGCLFGRIQWKWFAALAFGLVVVAAAGGIVAYFVEDNYTTTMANDTLT